MSRTAAAVVFVLLTVFLAAGCGRSVKFTVAEDFTERSTRTVAILPVSGAFSESLDDKRISELFRKFSAERLVQSNYSVVSSRALDESFYKLGGLDPDRADIVGLAGVARADALLLIKITKWREKLFTPFASLKVKVEYVLYSADGEELWRAGYGTKESDMKFDREVLRLGVIKVYETRIERIVATVFSTLPDGVSNTVEKDRPTKKKYFDWLK